MGIQELFNKAGKGVKTLFKKDGTLESLFNKGSSLAGNISKRIDKGLGTALDIGSKIGDVARSVAPALTAINPELGLAAMAVGNIANKANKYVGNVASKKQDIVNKVMDVKRGIMIPKPIEPIDNSNDQINFA